MLIVVEKDAWVREGRIENRRRKLDGIFMMDKVVVGACFNNVVRRDRGSVWKVDWFIL